MIVEMTISVVIETPIVLQVVGLVVVDVSELDRSVGVETIWEGCISRLRMLGGDGRRWSVFGVMLLWIGGGCDDSISTTEESSSSTILTSFIKYFLYFLDLSSRKRLIEHFLIKSRGDPGGGLKVMLYFKPLLCPKGNNFLF